MRWLTAAVALAAALAAAAVPARAAVPSPDARAFVVVDAVHDRVLAARNPHLRLPFASITKLMTALVALRHLRTDAVVAVAPGAARVGGARLGLRPGQRISVRDLLVGMLVGSANDAADALAAAAAGGDERRFVGWMNAEARRLGLRDTRFVRPDGLDVPGHVSSARDVSVLARAAMRVAAIRETVRRRSATVEHGAVRLHTWNDLLGRFPGLFGVMTGETAAAGWCEVAAARRGAVVVYAVVLGSPTRALRNDGLRRLLAWGLARAGASAVPDRA